MWVRTYTLWFARRNPTTRHCLSGNTQEPGTRTCYCATSCNSKQSCGANTRRPVPNGDGHDMHRQYLTNADCQDSNCSRRAVMLRCCSCPAGTAAAACACAHTACSGHVLACVLVRQKGASRQRQQAAPREDRHARTTRQCAEAPEPHLWHTSSKGCNFTLVV